MSIWEILQDKVLMQYVIWGAFLFFGVLYVIVRFIFYTLSRPKSKSFADEVNEHSNRPMSGSESIGGIGMRLGEDVRDVWEWGYSDDQINGVLTGKYTLDEMYKMGPDGNTKSAKGKEILAKKSDVN